MNRGPINSSLSLAVFTQVPTYDQSNSFMHNEIVVLEVILINTGVEHYSRLYLHSRIVVFIHYVLYEYEHIECIIYTYTETMFK